MVWTRKPLGSERLRRPSISEGISVRYLSSFLMPGDELCLHLLDGPSAEAVRLAAVNAGLDPLRVIETVTAQGFENGHGPVRKGAQGWIDE
jgi:hypothetical protein